MRELFSFLFDLATEPLGLPVDAWKEWIILGIIGVVAYIVAFRFIGDLYSNGEISGSTVGSIIHWIIRFGAFAVIWAVTYGVIAVGKFVIAHWLPFVCVAGALLLAAVTIIVLFRKVGENT